MRQRINAVVTAGFAAFSVLAMAPAAAQAPYPDKPVTLVVPFAAGGPTDVVARMLAIPMGKSLGQSVLVENTVGAGGTIAATKVARAAPNGYTLFIHHMGMSTAPALYKKLSFDPMKDYEYIGQVVDVPMTLLARKDFPPANYKELEAYVRANKDKVSPAAWLACLAHVAAQQDQPVVRIHGVGGRARVSSAAAPLPAGSCPAPARCGCSRGRCACPPPWWARRRPR
jgi:hypothetical protein